LGFDAPAPLLSQRCNPRHNLGFGFDDPIVASETQRPENGPKSCCKGDKIAKIRPKQGCYVMALRLAVMWHGKHSAPTTW